MSNADYISRIIATVSALISLGSALVAYLTYSRGHPRLGVDMHFEKPENNVREFGARMLLTNRSAIDFYVDTARLHWLWRKTNDRGEREFGEFRTVTAIQFERILIPAFEEAGVECRVEVPDRPQMEVDTIKMFAVVRYGPRVKSSHARGVYGESFEEWWRRILGV
jgi:hypothetical protein